MLIIVRSLRELNFGELMRVYVEGNLENGAELYADFSENEQLLRAEADFYTYLRECFFTVPGAVYAVWEEGGRYICALRLEPWQDGLLLEALETAPEKRGRGYAKMLMRAVLDTIPDKTAYSHVSKKNTASLAVHAACGFERILEHALCADGSVMTNLCTLRWTGQ